MVLNDCLNVVNSFERLQEEYCKDPDSDRCIALNKVFKSMSTELCGTDIVTLSALLDRLIELAISTDEKLLGIDNEVKEAVSIMDIIDEKFELIIGGSIKRDISHDIFVPLLHRKQYIMALKALRQFVTTKLQGAVVISEKTCAGCAATTEVLNICNFDADCINSVTHWLKDQKAAGKEVTDDELIGKAKELKKGISIPSSSKK